MSVGQHPDVARLTAARRSPVADTIGRLSDPGALVGVVLLVVALRSTGPVWVGLGWAAVAAAFCVGLPYAVLHALVRRGAVTDRHVVIRHQRRAPFVAGVVSVVLGVVLLYQFDAPAPITALVVAMLAGLTAMTVVSLFYKASMHVAVASGVAVILTITIGLAWALVFLPAVGLIAWARVRAGRHTAGQAIVGFAVGSAAAALVYPVLAS